MDTAFCLESQEPSSRISAEKIKDMDLDLRCWYCVFSMGSRSVLSRSRSKSVLGSGVRVRVSVPDMVLISRATTIASRQKVGTGSCDK